MATFRLPLDLTGSNPTNRVTQTRTLNMTSKMGDKFFIPADAPFFAEGLEVYKVGTPTPLVRGIDYELIFEYLDIFTVTQKAVFGGIKFKDRKISGQVRFVGQVLGGPFLQPVQNTLETIARNKTNVNTATWGEIAGVPAGFPVLNHPMISDDFTGFSDINTTLRNGVDLILAGQGGGGGDGAAMAALQTHLQNPTNAHSKAAVGLGLVPNFSMSTYEEADLGVNNRFVSPALTKYLISKYSGLSTIESIQQQITILNRDIQTVQQGLQENNTNVAELTKQVKTLSDSFQSVRQEFANVLNYINDLGNSIENIQGLVQEARAQVQDALERVTAMEAVVNQIKLENENISGELLRITQDIGGLDTRTKTLEITMAEIVTAVKKLNEAVLYPLRRFISGGSYNFSIKKGESRTITLVGPGGAGGVLIPIGQEGVSDGRGMRGGDTVLFLNTDVSNGANSVGQIVLKAEGGFGGQSAKQSSGGIDYFGKGGPGGNTFHTGLFSIITNAIGAGGVDGNASPGPSHPGAVGQVIQGKKFGDGGAAAITAGTGAAGAMIVAKVTNTYDFDLEFTVVVGEPASNPFGNNYLPPAPGLFILDLG